LQDHLYLLHKLGNANSVKNHHKYYQTLAHSALILHDREHDHPSAGLPSPDRTNPTDISILQRDIHLIENE
jgi:hypothetical protein